VPTWERGLDPYEFGDDADVFHTDGGIAGMMTFNTGAIEVTLDDEHIRLRAPFIIGADVAVDKSEVLAVYRGHFTGFRFVPKSDGYGIATYRLRGARIRGLGLKRFEERLRSRGWPVKRLSLIAEVRVSVRAGVEWLVGPRSFKIR
jgi:hypothetical protein